RTADRGFGLGEELGRGRCRLGGLFPCRSCWLATGGVKKGKSRVKSLLTFALPLPYPVLVRFLTFLIAAVSCPAGAAKLDISQLPPDDVKKGLAGIRHCLHFQFAL